MGPRPTAEDGTEGTPVTFTIEIQATLKRSMPVPRLNLGSVTGSTEMPPENVGEEGSDVAHVPPPIYQAPVFRYTFLDGSTNETPLVPTTDDPVDGWSEVELELSSEPAKEEPATEEDDNAEDGASAIGDNDQPEEWKGFLLTWLGTHGRPRFLFFRPLGSFLDPRGRPRFRGGSTQTSTLPPRLLFFEPTGRPSFFFGIFFEPFGLPFPRLPVCTCSTRCGFGAYIGHLRRVDRMCVVAPHFLHVLGSRRNLRTGLTSSIVCGVGTTEALVSEKPSRASIRVQCLSRIQGLRWYLTMTIPMTVPMIIPMTVTIDRLARVELGCQVPGHLEV